jgi:hypothetical protein
MDILCAEIAEISSRKQPSFRKQPSSRQEASSRQQPSFRKQPSSRQEASYPIAIIIEPECLQTYPCKHNVQFLYKINDEYRLYGKSMYGNAIWAMFKNMMTKAWEVEHFSQYEHRISLENPDPSIFEYFSNPNIRSNSRHIDIDEWMKMSHAFDDPPNTDGDDTHSADDMPDDDDDGDDTHTSDDMPNNDASNKNKVAEAMNTLQITVLTLENVKKAYRKLARIYHPDKSKAADRDKNTIKFREIQEAYEFLVKHLSALNFFFTTL